MKTRALGRTGINVSRLCFGTLTMSPLQNDMGASEAGRLLRFALDRGINVLDTAEYYRNYAHIAMAQSQAGGMSIVTKCHAWDRQGAKRSLDLALKATGRSCIDVMMLHEQESEWTLRGHEKALAYFFEAREKGLIRAVGVSTHFIACARAAAAMEGIDVIETICNERGIGIVDGSQSEMDKAMALAHQNGKGVIAMKALAGGHLIRDAAQALTFVIDRPYVDTVAVGMQSEAEIEYNLSVIEGNPRTDLTGDLNRTPKRLHIAQWCTGCGECAGRCQNGALHVIDGKMQVEGERCVRCGYCAQACKEFCIKVY
jgi:aryl-alcohol dehydrogenase-like predicted oxidoreductase